MDAIGAALVLAVIFLGPGILVIWGERRTNGPINPKAIRELIAALPEAQEALQRLGALETKLAQLEQQTGQLERDVL